MATKKEIINQEKRAKSQQVLLTAAFTLFAKNGYYKTSIAQIANEAGVSKGLVYNYFKSKEEVLIAVFQNKAARFDGVFEFNLNQNPKVILKELIDQAFVFMQSQSELARLLFMLALQHDAMAIIQPYLDQLKAEKIKKITPLFKALGYANAFEEACFLSASLDGLGMAILTDSAFPATAMRNRIYNIYKIENQ